MLSEPGTQRPLDPTAEIAIDTTADAASLIARLADTDNLYEQIELLAALARIQSLDAVISMRGDTGPVRELIEEVYEQAGRRRLWAIMRRAAGLLGKVDGDLNLAVGAILVRQKNIQVGRAYSDDSLISHPHSGPRTAGEDQHLLSRRCARPCAHAGDSAVPRAS